MRQLQLYLRDTETERIRGGGGGGTRLLLHWDPLIDDIQRTHVSRWLVEVVQEAYTRADLEYDDDIRAHELRAIASSWAYVNQVRLEDILAAASWRSSGVFQGPYLRDMSSIADGMATLGPIVAAVPNGDYLVGTWYLRRRYVGQEIYFPPSSPLDLKLLVDYKSKNEGVNV